MREVFTSPEGLSTVSIDTLSRSLSRMEGSVTLQRQPSPYSGKIWRMASAWRA